MFAYPPTIVIRHNRENLKKCSLSGLESRNDFLFLSYPLGTQQVNDITKYLLLTMDKNVKPLSKDDACKGLLLLDGTWRLAQKMEDNIPGLKSLEKRSLPCGFVTAYPRRQQDCPDPQRGLSSLEALAIAYLILGRDIDSLLQNYYWREIFFTLNKSSWEKYGRTS